MVGRIEDEGERHLENFGDLDRVGDETLDRPHQPDDRRHVETGAGKPGVEPPDDFDMAGRQADFLLGLAQRRGARIAVLGIDPSAGQRDLAGMIGKIEPRATSTAPTSPRADRRGPPARRRG